MYIYIYMYVHIFIYIYTCICICICICICLCLCLCICICVCMYLYFYIYIVDRHACVFFSATFPQEAPRPKSAPALSARHWVSARCASCTGACAHRRLHLLSDGCRSPREDAESRRPEATTALRWRQGTDTRNSTRSQTAVAHPARTQRHERRRRPARTQRHMRIVCAGSRHARSPNPPPLTAARSAPRPRQAAAKTTPPSSRSTNSAGRPSCLGTGPRLLVGPR